MKIFRRALYGFLIVCLIALFAALLFRIYIQEQYPEESVRMVFTEQLTEYYNATDDFKVYTQKIRAPYDDNNDGNFFAEELYVVPNADHLQVTLRYSDAALERIAKAYGKTEPLVPSEGLFRYVLTASYNSDESGNDFRTYESAYCKETSAYMYHYDKLAFDGAEFDGAAWMRVDIYLAGEEKLFGSIIVYESNFEYDGDVHPYELEERSIDKGDLPQ